MIWAFFLTSAIFFSILSGIASAKTSAADPYAKGLALFNSKQYFSALHLLERAVAENPNSSSYHSLGLCQIQMGIWREGVLNLYLSDRLEPNLQARSYADHLKAGLSASDQKWIEAQLGPSAQTGINGYAAINSDGRLKSDKRLVHLFRKFQLDGSPKFLGIDCQTLQVLLLDAGSFQCDPSYARDTQASRYGKALEVSSKFLGHLEGNGMTHALPGAPSGVFLTADLCPSHRHRLDRSFFKRLAQIQSNTQNAVPIGIAVTGDWLQSHEKEFEYLKDLENRGTLKITWINHTYHHPTRVGRRLSAEENFSPMKSADPSEEVLGLEVSLLQRGELPSPYFRFPDLVADADWMRTIKNLSLITVGSDSWLAKGETPRPGSIILVHANGNEPKGIKFFFSWLAQSGEMGPFRSLADLFPVSPGRS